MKSKAHFKTHPLHPMFVVFPIAFFTGAFVFDVIAVVCKNPNLFFVGRYLIIGGLAGGLLAAVPGIIDAVYTVPPQSSAKTRVIKHGLLNSLVLCMFVVVFILRNNVSEYTILALELVAVITLWVSGWLGATLVHRNHISVYNRYADSGHWQEQYFKENVIFPFVVADSKDLKTDQMKLVHIGNERIVIARTAQQFVAFEDRCTHKGGSLAAGTMICGTVQCPWHGTQFDVCSGEVKAGPGKTAIKTYRITEENGKVILHR